MTTVDDRIADGMRAQLALRRERLAAGDRALGWKVGFGSAAAMATLRTGRPLVGFLLEGNRLPDGAAVSLDGWAAPALEPEIAAHLGRDVPPGASADAIRSAVAGLSAAIELVDVDPPPTDVRKILAGNVYHRHVVLGPVRDGWTPPAQLSGLALVDGDEVAATDDVTALTGDLLEVLRLTAELLQACGEQLRAGDVVITGSVVPPVQLVPGHTVSADLGLLGKLSVSLQ
ncbi:MAG TPA: fumarylacetoacetate hydrolase family protein [Mycobacteriales bacterium]